MTQAAPAARASVISRPHVLSDLARRPSGAFGLITVVLLALILAVGPVLAPYPFAKQDVSHRNEGPSASHVLGTDHLGRDLLSRLLTGTRIALGTAFPAVLAALLAGLVLGLVAGYAGGRIDNLTLIILDTVQAFPTVALMLALLALLGPSTRNVIIVIALTFAPGYARVTRAQVLAVKENPFIEVERSLGASGMRIVFVHILANVLAPLFILLAMDLPSAIATEAGLSFLGFGVRPPTPSWGVMLSDGFSRIRTSPWPVLWPSLALMVTTLGFTFFGEALRDILDPKLAGSRRA